MGDFLSDLVNLEDVIELLDATSFVYIGLVLAVFFVGKKAFDWLTPFVLRDEIVHVDNHAVAVTYAGYVIGLGILLLGVIGQEPVASTGSARRDLWIDLGDTALWAVIGIALLHLARVINDKVLLRAFCNTTELVRDRNLGTGAVEFGSMVGSAWIVRTILQGEGEGLVRALGETAVYFVAAQVIFLIFGAAYQKLTSYDVHAEIERGNAAAGVSLGSSLIAAAVLTASYLERYDSLLGLALWLGLSLFVLVGSRYLVDRFLLPGRSLDAEIREDQNWGAALVEGSAAVALAFLVGASF